MKSARISLSMVFPAIVVMLATCGFALGVLAHPNVAFASEATDAKVATVKTAAMDTQSATAQTATTQSATTQGTGDATATKPAADTASTSQAQTSATAVEAQMADSVKNNAVQSQTPAQGGKTDKSVVGQAAATTDSANAKADAVAEKEVSGNATTQAKTVAKDVAGDASKAATDASKNITAVTDADLLTQDSSAYAGVGVTYNTHVQNVGWQSYVKDGATAGTSGKAFRLEGIHIKLTGNAGLSGSVEYTTHVQNIGWQPWVKNGSMAGTSGQSLRLEAIQIKLSAKTEEAAGKDIDTVGVRYDAHVQNDGWHTWVGDGETSGTVGRSLRVEGFNIKVDPGLSSGGVEYQAHVQNIGWQNWVKDGALGGTSGRGLRVEALRINLTGDIANTHNIYYRAHVQNVGWLDWAVNGGSCGSAGYSYRMEGLQIVVREKGEGAPKGSTDKPFYSKQWSQAESQYLKNNKVNQLVEVKYTGGSYAELKLLKKTDGAWVTTLSSYAYVGKGGIGKTTDNDHRTPEGDFAITGAFGVKSNPGANITYTRINPNMYWCNDSASYNKLVDMTKNQHNCTGIHFVEQNPAFDYGLFIDFNTNPVRSGAGSGIFLHRELPYTGATDYGVSMSEASILEIIRTVTSGARVLIYNK